MENYIELVSAINNPEKISLKIRYSGKVYTLEFRSFLRGIPPGAAPDYQKKIAEHIDILERENHRSIVFVLPVALEKIDVVEGIINVSFVMPGLASLGGVIKMDNRFHMRLDSSKQDMKGSLGLKIECVIKRAE